jgi:hypothetical protein
MISVTKEFNFSFGAMFYRPTTRFYCHGLALLRENLLQCAVSSGT